MLRSTTTYVILDVSPSTYEEIYLKLRAAGYDHLINGGTINMHGLALEAELGEVTPPEQEAE